MSECLIHLCVIECNANSCYDGMKVNYLNLQDVLATIPRLAAKED